MKQADYIKQMAKLALANDNARLLDLLYQFVEYSHCLLYTSPSPRDS